jgi:hypothetical protein
MSTCGLLLETDQGYSLGETIRFSLTLDGSAVSCEGTVVRTETIASKFGIAVELVSYGFQSQPEVWKHIPDEQKTSKASRR